MFNKLITRALLSLTVPAALGTTLAATSGTAHAATPGYVALAWPSLNERVAPSTASAVTGSLSYHSPIAISCQTEGTDVNGSVIWDRLTNGSYVSDYYVSTPLVGRFSPGLARCGGDTPSPTPAGPRTGSITSYDQGGTGECTWWADYEFHAYSGVWPNFVWPVDNGNAEYWAENAAHNGWTVTSTPTPYSIAVFPPGVNGAGADGHVAWVTAVSGNHVTVSEMNFDAFDWVDVRTVVAGPSVSYIVAP